MDLSKRWVPLAGLRGLQGDAPAVERVAHKLKGGSGSMGARKM